MKKLLLLSFFILFIFPANLFAQDKDRKLNIDLKEMGLSYHQPQGFSALDSVSTFMCGKDVIISAFLYSITNKENNIVIAFTMSQYKYIRIGMNSSFYKHRFPDLTPNNMYLNVIKLQADTIHNKVVHYSKDYRRSTSNADDAGEYILDCPFLYKGKYPHCKVVFLHKDNIGDIQLFYFFTDEAKGDIDRCVGETASMISYKD